MKASKLLIIAVLFTSSLFAFSPAKAQTTSTVAIESTGGLFDWLTDLFGGGSSSSSSKSSTGSTGSTGSTSGASLPIDNQVWFLIAAAAVVGTRVIVKKSKSAAVNTSNL